MLAAAAFMQSGAAIEFLARLNRVPKLVVNDPQVRRWNDLPLVRRVRTGNAFPRFRVFDHVDAVKNEQPDISLVIEDATSALEVAVDG